MSHSAKLLPVLATTAIALLSSTRALGWGFGEHKDLCKEAYLQACQATEARAHADPQAKARWQMACAPKTIQPELYGQACGLAGDRVATPEELTTAKGGVSAFSDVHYYLLALINAEHFQPQSLHYWLDYHGRAVALARAGAGLNDGAQVEQFEKSMTMSAFANHFLADSFATGHMGFNRAASSAGAAAAYHDVWNENGRWLRSADGSEWFAKGDGRLRESDNFGHVFWAMALATRDVMETFVFGSASRPYVVEIWRMVPAELQVVHKKHYFLWFAVDELDDPRAPAQSYEPLGAVRRPAKYSFAWAFSPELKYGLSGPSERSLMGQFSLGPYRSNMSVVRGFYLDFRLGYGREGDPWDLPRAHQRDGIAAGINADFPVVRTINGLMYGDVVIGVQTLGWNNVSADAALRASFFLGRFLLQLTAGVADRFYDHGVDNRWSGSERFSIMSGFSVGYLHGRYPFRSWGVPQASQLNE